MTSTITIINGPNLNLLGRRQPEIYGRENLDQLAARLQTAYPDCELIFLQSNHEGQLVDWLQQAAGQTGIILNAAGLSYSSVAIRDAVEAINTPVVEVHLSNIAAREPFRRQSLISAVCRGTITGLGGKGYLLALQYLMELE
ncbi:MAG: type II 3-dehydroquinate dehydratase [Candidatus Delongbacteria bacterium]|nr:type II 3-dehydroquinate dehydratase [Candidatus Delongbacteria bacterium]